jgi:hypothetical protein
MKQESSVVKRYGKTKFTQPTIEVTNAPFVIPFQELTLSGWFWDVFLNDPYGCFQKAFSVTDFMLIDSILFGGC